MSYKIIRYRKRLFCELGQLFAGCLEYSKQRCRKVLFHKKFFILQTVVCKTSIRLTCTLHTSKIIAKKKQQLILSHTHHCINQFFLIALQQILFHDFSVFHANDGLATV